MTIEQVELRKILSQMLADNGVNRETIIPFVKDVLQEKMDRAAKQVAAETNLDELVRRIIEREIANAIRDEVRDKVRQCFATINVSVEVPNKG